MKLSIITVNLNNRDGLKKTIDSVVCQTFKNFEWIIIDGGSTDGSKELIEKYSEHFSYWVSEPDKGIYNAMNKGICVAKGEYVLHLNSGDILYNENSLNNVISNKLESDIIFFSIIHEKPQFTFIEKSPEQITARYLFYNTLPHSGSSLIRKELFKSVGIYNEQLKIASDWAFYVNAIILNNATVSVRNEILSFYDGSGISAVHTHVYQKEMCDYLNRIIPQKILDDYNYFERKITDLEGFYRSSKKVSSISWLVLLKAIVYKVIRSFI